VSSGAVLPEPLPSGFAAVLVSESNRIQSRALVDELFPLLQKSYLFRMFSFSSEMGYCSGPHFFHGSCGLFMNEQKKDLGRCRLTGHVSTHSSQWPVAKEGFSRAQIL
jgi:hypothetical protein